jgi:hypothetical protein
MAQVESHRAVRESEGCIRLIPSLDGVEWRVRKSGRYGPRVRQAEHLAIEDLKEGL